ncbi:MAG: NifU family protein [Bdellovibrionaceae bacterium]|nr:NifU family protein [Pseudobdellovibrionaceae bacterium]
MNQNSATTARVRYEATPNPSTYKFIFPEDMVIESREFSTPQEAEISPLAAKLFGFPWTSKVFIGKDFVSITKQDWVDWTVLAEPLNGLIQEHLDKGEKVLHDFDPTLTQNNEHDADPIVRQLKQIIKNEIQPIVALDGGEIVFHSYKDNVVFIQMKGSCAGCPSSTATLKEGIEVRIKELIPEVKEVVAI